MNADNLEMQLFVAIKYAEGGLTDEEMQQRLELPAAEQRKLRASLVRANRVEKTGEFRKTTSGRQAVVWRAVWRRRDRDKRGGQQQGQENRAPARLSESTVPATPAAPKAVSPPRPAPPPDFDPGVIVWPERLDDRGQWVRPRVTLPECPECGGITVEVDAGRVARCACGFECPKIKAARESLNRFGKARSRSPPPPDTEPGPYWMTGKCQRCGRSRRWVPEKGGPICETCGEI